MTFTPMPKKKVYSGRKERLPYSLSRWTDLPTTKWDWFQGRLREGWFLGFDPRTTMPCRWSLKPEDTYGLIFWTRCANNLVQAADTLKQYPLVVHYTLTGWEEVERGCPDIESALSTMARTVDVFGPKAVTWRFSPVPLVDDVLERFQRIAKGVEALGLKEAYVAFLQENDQIPETRPQRVREELLRQMAASTGLKLRVCWEDSTKIQHNEKLGLTNGICEPGDRFATEFRDRPKVESCGCALAVDPFTITETCRASCSYCYAADKSLRPKKHNTTPHRTLKVVP